MRESGGGQDLSGRHRILRESAAVVIFLDRRQILREFVFFRGGCRFLRKIGDAESYRRRILRGESSSPHRPDEVVCVYTHTLEITKFTSSQSLPQYHGTQRIDNTILQYFFSI
jgi:hypothetical protein